MSGRTPRKTKNYTTAEELYDALKEFNNGRSGRKSKEDVAKIKRRLQRVGSRAVIDGFIREHTRLKALLTKGNTYKNIINDLYGEAEAEESGSELELVDEQQVNNILLVGLLGLTGVVNSLLMKRMRVRVLGTLLERPHLILRSLTSKRFL